MWLLIMWLLIIWLLVTGGKVATGNVATHYSATLHSGWQSDRTELGRSLQLPFPSLLAPYMLPTPPSSPIPSSSPPLPLLYPSLLPTFFNIFNRPRESAKRWYFIWTHRLLVFFIFKKVRFFWFLFLHSRNFVLFCTFFFYQKTKNQKTSRPRVFHKLVLMFSFFILLFTTFK